jgi:hypothetical protein
MNETHYFLLFLSYIIIAVISYKTGRGYNKGSDSFIPYIIMMVIFVLCCIANLIQLIANTF